MRRVLVPSEPRQFPGRVWVRVSCRSLHILCIGIYVGGVLFGASAAELTPWLRGAAVTGGALILTDLYGSLIYLAELRGLAMLAKLALLGVAVALPARRLALLVGLVVFSSVVSHMPSRWRHWTVGVGAPSRAQRRSGRG